VGYRRKMVTVETAYWESNPAGQIKEPAFKVVRDRDQRIVATGHSLTNAVCR